MALSAKTDNAAPLGKKRGGGSMPLENILKFSVVYHIAEYIPEAIGVMSKCSSFIYKQVFLKLNPQIAKSNIYTSILPFLCYTVLNNSSYFIIKLWSAKLKCSSINPEGCPKHYHIGKD